MDWNISSTFDHNNLFKEWKRGQCISTKTYLFYRSNCLSVVEAMNAPQANLIAFRKSDGRLFEVSNLELDNTGEIHMLFLMLPELGPEASGCVPHDDYIVYQRIGKNG